jgi:hypothetical protein
MMLTQLPASRSSFGAGRLLCAKPSDGGLNPWRCGWLYLMNDNNLRAERFSTQVLYLPFALVQVCGLREQKGL